MAAVATGTWPEPPCVPTRVVTLTPAPAVDRVYVVDDLRAGRVNRARHVEAHIAGNGVNLARDLAANGNPVAAVVPLDPDSAAEFAGDTARLAVVSVPHPARSNTIVVGAEGVTTNINEPAHPLGALGWGALHRAVAREVGRVGAEWLVVGGSVPDESDGSGIDPVTLVRIARRHGARVCVDAPGSALSVWLDAGAGADLVAPNLHELAEASERRIETLRDASEAADSVRERGARAVLVSLGEHGLLAVTEHTRLWARTPPARVVNTTGAGDAAPAGFLSAWRGEDDPVSLRAALVRGALWGRAATERVGATVRPEEVVAVPVAVRPPRPDFPLRG